MTVTSKRYHSNIDDAGVSYGSSLGTGNKRVGWRHSGGGLGFHPVTRLSAVLKMIPSPPESAHLLQSQRLM